MYEGPAVAFMPQGPEGHEPALYEGRPWPRRHCDSWGSSSPTRKGHSPQFSAHVYCGQKAGCIRIPLGTEVGQGPGDIVLDGDPDPNKGHMPPVYGPCLLWPNGWMDQDARYASARRHCVRWGPSSPSKRAQPPAFGPCLLWPNGRRFCLKI